MLVSVQRVRIACMIAVYENRVRKSRTKFTRSHTFDHFLLMSLLVLCKGHLDCVDNEGARYMHTNIMRENHKRN